MWLDRSGTTATTESATSIACEGADAAAAVAMKIASSLFNSAAVAAAIGADSGEIFAIDETARRPTALWRDMMVLIMVTVNAFLSFFPARPTISAALAGISGSDTDIMA